MRTDETRQPMEIEMQKTSLMLFASAVLTLPGGLAAMAQGTSTYQAPSPVQPQIQSPGQPQVQSPEQPQMQSPVQPQADNQQAAAGQSIPSKQLGRSGVRQMQQALNKNGQHVRADGVVGPQTRQALQSYQKSKGMPANGRINQQTLADLGVQAGQPNQNRQPASGENNNNQPGGQTAPGGTAGPGNNP